MRNSKYVVALIKNRQMRISFIMRNLTNYLRTFKMELVATNGAVVPYSLGTFFGTFLLKLLHFPRKTFSAKVSPYHSNLTYMKSNLSALNFFLSQKLNANDEFRMVLAVRTDLGMQKGKVAVQCAHAAVAAYTNALRKDCRSLQYWLMSGKINSVHLSMPGPSTLVVGQAKIAVKISSEQELIELARKARASGIVVSIVRDAGRTQVESGTKTIVALGPAPKSALDSITGHLKLF